MEAYDFIKLYQGDFPKCKCFWLHPVLPFCFSIIASKITNVHKLLPLKNFFRVEGGRGTISKSKTREITYISRKSFELFRQGKYEYSQMVKKA